MSNKTLAHPIDGTCGLRPAPQIVALKQNISTLIENVRNYEKCKKEYDSSSLSKKHWYFRTSKWNYAIFVADPTLLILVAWTDWSDHELSPEMTMISPATHASWHKDVNQDKWPELYEIENKLSAAHIEGHTIPYIGDAYVPEAKIT